MLPKGAPEHLDQALHELNMARHDLTFDKDHGEPLQVLPLITNLLENPLEFPAYADRTCVAALSDEGLWDFARSTLDVSDDAEMASDAPAVTLDYVPPQLQAALAAFVAGAQRCDQGLQHSFSALDQEDRQRLVAWMLMDALSAEEDSEELKAFEAAGIPESVSLALLEERKQIDAEPAVTAHLKRVEAVQLGALLSAAEEFLKVCRALRKAIPENMNWPAKPARVKTGIGEIVIGTTGTDRYTDPALLILDPDGDDVYAGEVGSANGLRNRRIGVILDLGGNDLYRSDAVTGAGSAMLGIAVLTDVSGDDIYQHTYLGQGSAMAGVALHDEEAGNDAYTGDALCQGAACLGLARLNDRSGDDRYRIGISGQAFAGTLGVGLLVDHTGADTYFAGGYRPDEGRHEDRFSTLSQGFSIGMRPFAGGGVAALIDREGNDTYRADVYGQGVSYWYAVGMLLDYSGHDSYTVYHYGQGSGIHLSLGMLSDGGGNDTYTGYALAQGNGHDYAVGMLFDHGGNDSYTADHFSQGRGMYNAFGWLHDVEGDDVYAGRKNESCQGTGHNGGPREFGSIGVLTDTGGTDQFSSGSLNNGRRIRPLFGVVLDSEVSE